MSERIESLSVHAFEVPADGPDGQEQDGTMTWSSTTIVLVQAHGGGETGLGYTYGDASVAPGDFHTHVRLESLAFDGVLSPSGGALRPDALRPGLGLEVKWADLENYRVYGSGRRP